MLSPIQISLEQQLYSENFLRVMITGACTEGFASTDDDDFDVR